MKFLRPRPSRARRGERLIPGIFNHTTTNHGPPLRSVNSDKTYSPGKKGRPFSPPGGAVKNIDLEIKDKEFMVLVGPLGLREVLDPSDDRRARGYHWGHSEDRR